MPLPLLAFATTLAGLPAAPSGWSVVYGNACGDQPCGCNDGTYYDDNRAQQAHFPFSFTHQDRRVTFETPEPSIHPHMHTCMRMYATCTPAHIHATRRCGPAPCTPSLCVSLSLSRSLSIVSMRKGNTWFSHPLIPSSYLSQQATAMTNQGCSTLQER